MTVTLAEASKNLPSLWDKATEDREIIFVQRKGSSDIALIAADELNSLMESAYLLRSPANARRLSSALRRAEAGEGTPQTVDQLRAEFGLFENAADAEINSTAD